MANLPKQHGVTHDQVKGRIGLAKIQLPKQTTMFSIGSPTYLPSKSAQRCMRTT
jgi:hypothetical protein